MIVSELTTNGVMGTGQLYESPFLDISPQRPEGPLPVAKVDRMLRVLGEIRRRAAAWSTPSERVQFLRNPAEKAKLVAEDLRIWCGVDALRNLEEYATWEREGNTISYRKR